MTSRTWRFKLCMEHLKIELSEWIQTDNTVLSFGLSCRYDFRSLLEVLGTHQCSIYETKLFTLLNMVLIIKIRESNRCQYRIAKKE